MVKWIKWGAIIAQLFVLAAIMACAEQNSEPKAQDVAMAPLEVKLTYYALNG